MSRTYEQLEPVISALDNRISAKAEQIDALDTRVTAVEGGIGETNERLGELKSALDYVEDDVINLDDGTIYLNADLVVGNISLNASSDTGIALDTTIKYRVSTESPVNLIKGDVFTIKNGYRIIIFRNNGSGKYTSTTAWLTGSYTVPASVDAYIVIAETTDVTTKTADVDEFKRAIIIRNKIYKRIGTVSNDVALISENTKNILTFFDGNTSVNGVIIHSDIHGNISMSGTPTGPGGRTTAISNNVLLEAGTYTFSVNSTDSDVLTLFREIYINDANTNSVISQGDLSGKKTFTINNDTLVYIGANIYTNYSSYYNGKAFSVQIESGNKATNIYPNKSAYDVIARSEIENLHGNETVRLNKSGNLLTIKTKFNDSDLTLTAYITQEDSPNKAIDFGGYSGAINKTADDDICPIYYNGSYRCAGHGSLTVFQLASSSHGKTDADIGKIYSDGTTNWVLITIPSEDTLWIMSEVTNEPTRPFVTTIASSGTLTNATGNIVYTSATLTQLRPQNIRRSVSVYAGTKLVELDGDYVADKIILTESYQSLNCVNMISYLKSNVGSNTNSSYYLDAIGGDLQYDVSYKIYPNSSCVVHNTITILRDNIDLSMDGITQCQSYSETAYVPFSNYKTPTVIASTINLLSSTWDEATLPPYKYYELDTDNGLGFGVGYDITFGDGKPENRVNNISGAGNFNGSSKKIYPNFIGNGSVLPKGTQVSGIAFRMPVEISSGTFGFLWDAGDHALIEIEALSTGFVNVSIPVKYIGRTYSVVNADDSINVKDGTLSTNKLTVYASGVGSATLLVN